MYDINIIVIEMPLSVKGATVIKNGVYHIVINEGCDTVEKNEILLEELTGIYGFPPKDFEKFRFTEGDIKK